MKYIPLMRIKSAQITQNHDQIGYAWYSRRAVASFIVEGSSEVFLDVTLWRHRVAVRFLPITFDRNELKMWGWCHSICLVKAHRLTCNINYLGHADLDLAWPEVIFFLINLSKIKNIWIDPPWGEEHDGVKVFT